MITKTFSQGQNTMIYQTRITLKLNILVILFLCKCSPIFTEKHYFNLSLVRRTELKE